MAAVYEGRALRAQRIGGSLERLIYRGAGVDPAREMGWIDYALAMLWFNLLGALVVYALQRLQQWLPLNPQDMAAVSPIRRSTPRRASPPTRTGRATAARAR